MIVSTELVGQPVPQALLRNVRLKTILRGEHVKEVAPGKPLKLIVVVLQAAIVGLVQKASANLTVASKGAQPISRRHVDPARPVQVTSKFAHQKGELDAVPV